MLNNIAIFATFTMRAGRALFNSVQWMGDGPAVHARYRIITELDEYYGGFFVLCPEIGS